MAEQGLPPILPDGPLRVLILGSFPSKASLAAGQYYAHPQNWFWRVLAGCGVVRDAAAPYPQRTADLTARAIGLWDLYARVERTADSSSDAHLTAHVPNAIAALWRERGPFRVVLNGQRRREWRRSFADLPVEPQEAPSTSPRPQHWNTAASRRDVFRAWCTALTLP